MPNEGLFGLPLGGDPARWQVGRYYKLLVEAGGVRHVTWTLRTSQALTAAGSWMERHKDYLRDGLLVVGPCGTGKTTLIQSVYMLLARNAPYFAEGGERDAFGRVKPLPPSRRAVYYSARDLYHDPRFDPDSHEWTYRSVYAECRDAGLCVLDDVGREVASFKHWGNEYKLVSRLLLERYDMRRPTVISSNLPVEDLAKRYGDFVADRLYEMCNLVRIEQQSFRPEEATQDG